MSYRPRSKSLHEQMVDLNLTGAAYAVRVCDVETKERLVEAMSTALDNYLVAEAASLRGGDPQAQS